MIGGSGGKIWIAFSRKQNLSDIGRLDIGRLIKQQRVMSGLTLRQLSEKSGVSPSHLGRIERGERFPSARILKKIAQPLGFTEGELFTLADYLPPHSTATVDSTTYFGKLDPYVARVLSEEPVEVQRTVIVILSLLKIIASK